MAYTSANLIAGYLKRDLTANEQLTLVTLIPAIKTWLDNKLGSNYDSASATTRYYDGGTETIDLDPCQTITEIKAINDDLSDSYIYDLTVTPEVIFEPVNQTIKREARKRNGCFPSGIRRIAVTATFTEFSQGVPHDVELAATSIAASILASSAQQSNVQSESLEGHSITYTNDTIDKIGLQDPQVLNLLEQRREVYV